MKSVVGGALFRNGKLLVVKRNDSRELWPNMWEIPGGRVEQGEDDKKALIREFVEETCIKIKIKNKYHTFHYRYNNQPAEENDYLVEAKDFTVKISSNEHTSFKWVKKDEAEKLLMSPDMKKSILKAFETGKVA